MEILLWLLPTFLVTGAAMLVAGWSGRERTSSDKQTEKAQERFAEAILKKHPASSVSRPRRARDGSTGIAVRPSRSAARPAGRPTDDTRRSA